MKNYQFNNYDQPIPSEINWVVKMFFKCHWNICKILIFFLSIFILLFIHIFFWLIIFINGILIPFYIRLYIIYNRYYFWFIVRIMVLFYYCDIFLVYLISFSRDRLIQG